MCQAEANRLLPFLLSAARRAGQAIMDIYTSSQPDTQLKDDRSPVTAADLAAHRVLVAALAGLLPDCPVVSEEDRDSQRYRQATGRFWLIDPLDGTKEFLARNGEFTVNIALISQGRSVLVASKSHLNAETQAFIDRLGVVKLVQAGSSLKLCRIAEGAADIYPRLAPTCEWDTAAAQAVLEGAGGVVLDEQRAPLHYGKPDVLNPGFIATRCETLLPA